VTAFQLYVRRSRSAGETSTAFQPFALAETLFYLVIGEPRRCIFSDPNASWHQLAHLLPERCIQNILRPPLRIQRVGRRRLSLRTGHRANTSASLAFYFGCAVGRSSIQAPALNERVPTDHPVSLQP
jgi:hypothetical protein